MEQEKTIEQLSEEFDESMEHISNDLIDCAETLSRIFASLGKPDLALKYQLSAENERARIGRTN